MASRGARTAILWALGLCLCISLALPSAADPVAGAWSEVFDWPVVAVHVAQLKTGEILIWSHRGDQAQVLNPEGECWEGNACFTPKPNPVNIFCGGHTHLDDGSVIVNGGHLGNHIGLAETFLFEYDHHADDWNWTALGEVEDTDFARWYPTLTTLPDGRVLNVSGSQKRCSSGALTGQLCGEHEDCPPAATPNCEAFLVKEPEVFDPADRTWTTLTGITQSVEFYPFNFVGPDGHVFFAGADSGAGTYDIDPTFNFNFHVDDQNLSFVDSSTHAGGSAAMYGPGQILKTGGMTTWPNAIADAEIIDLNGAATWADTSPMLIPRRRHNLTVLPDGTVLATGGTRRGNLEFERTCGGTNEGAPCGNSNDCPGEITCQENPSGEQFWVAEAELWDPAAGTWTLMAGAQVPRLYHSTAILLPDGRVLSAGGGPVGFGGAANTYSDAELYSPPYLFADGPRPTIAKAPEIIHYAESFRVESPEAAAIDRVSLIRLAAVTHSFDQDRRFVPLTFNPVGDFGLDINAPAGPNSAPPGYYMLFLLSDGVPSVARFVRLLPSRPAAGATHEYAAKVVCGSEPPEVPSRREPGHYSTSVNVHNPGPDRTRFFKKLALTYPPGDQREGKVLPIGHHALRYDEALQSDCADLRRKLIPGGTAPFFEGYLVLQSHGPLDVTAVYTTSNVGPDGEPGPHSSVDVERVPERRPETDLSVNKTVTLLPPVVLSDRVSWHLAFYTINVSNSGPGNAAGVVLNDELALDAVDAFAPGGIVTNPITLPAGAVITSTAQPALNLSTMTIELADLAPGETATVSFWAIALTITFGAPNPQVVLRDRATVSSSAVETAPANNTVTVESILLP